MDTHSDCMDCQWFFLGDYILQNLARLGIKNIFGIPGDYVLDFIRLIEKFPGISFINTCDENGAAVAADTYARINGVGCLCITYGVGGLKTLNALGNAFVEKSPVILISGAPPISEKSKFNNLHLLHHEITKFNSQLTMVREVTCYQAVLDDPFTAIIELNKAFKALKKYSQPIYIELPKDFAFKKSYTLTNTPSTPTVLTDSPTLPDPNFTSTLWEAASEMMYLIKNSHRALVMVGLEVDRFNANRQVIEFIERTQLPFCTTVMGKSTFGENNRLFAGCYVGKMSNKEVYNYVESRDCCIMMGVLITDTVSGLFSSKRFLRNDDNIKLTMDGIQINNHSYPHINMIQILNLILSNEVFREDFNAIYANHHAYSHNNQKIQQSTDNYKNSSTSSEEEEDENGKEINGIERKKDTSSSNQDITFTKGKVWKTNLPTSFLKNILNFEPSPNRPLQNDIVYKIINRWINANTTVLCDVGDPSFGTYDLFMPKGSIYLNPAIYLSLGFGVPGALGACAADPERRTIAICGDGGFQMTCQEISAIARYHYHPVIIILNNNGYTTEKGLDAGIKNANTIHPWNYEKLIELVGTGRYIGNIHTEKDLDLALCHCFDMSYAMAMNNSATTTTKYSERDSHGQPLQKEYVYDYTVYSNEPNKETEWTQYYYKSSKKGDQEIERGEENNNKEKILKHGNKNKTSSIIDLVYSKEKRGFISYPEYWNSIMKREKRGYGMDGDDDDDNTSDTNRKDNREKGRKSIPSKLKTNYFTIIEINLEEMGMSTGSQQFITLGKQKERM